MAEEFGLPSNIQLSGVKITGGDGKTMDVTDICYEIIVYEELGSTQLHGKVVFADKSGFFTKFPLVGNELFQFTVKKLDFEMTPVFVISSVDSVDITNDGGIMFGISIVEERNIVNASTLVSQAYEGTVSSIVESIYKDYLGSELRYVDETSGNYKFVIPNWKPLAAIDWLMRRAVDKNGVPIVLTNNLRNGSALVSYDSLFKRGIAEEFFINNFPSKEASSKGNAHNFRQIQKKPMTFSTKASGNTLQQMYLGTYSHSSLNVDTTNKSADLLEFGGDDDFLKKPRLNKFLAVNEDATYTEEKKKVTELFKTKQMVAYNQGYSFGDDFLSYNSDVNSVVPFRNNYHNVLNSYVYEMTIHGRFDIEAGSIVNLQFPANKLLNKEEPETNIDNRRSGAHIVTAVAHKFNIDKYHMALELKTDGFGEAHAIK